MNRQRGFTLIELGIVIALIGVMAAMAGPNLYNLRNNMASREAALQTRVLFRKAQSRAVSQGMRHMAVIRMRSTASAPDYLTLFEMAPPPATQYNGYDFPVTSLSTAHMEGTSPAPAPLKFVDRVNMPPRVGFGPAAGSSAYITFPYPFSAIAHAKQCTFCGSTNGALYFETDGSVIFTDGASYSTATAPLDGSVTISPQKEWSGTTFSTMYTVTLMSNGAIRVWQPK